MFKDITIGQYYPTDSIIHKLDPRTKINSTLLYIIFLFVVNNLWGYMAAFVFLAFVVTLSKVPVKYILKGLKPLVIIITLTVLLNMLWTPGNVIFQVWIIKITDMGINNAVNMGLRLILLISGTSIMTLTTSTLDLTDGL